jgi:hypothetical protein
VEASPDTFTTDTVALAVHPRKAPGGVQVVVVSTVLLQLAWQVWLTLQVGGVTVVSHWGAVYDTLHPPRHVTLAPQLTCALAETLQSPAHVPEHVPPQCVP